MISAKDYVNAFKAFLKSDFDKRVVTAAYEISDPTIDSQVVSLKSSGAESAFWLPARRNFRLRLSAKVAEIGWKPTAYCQFFRRLRCRQLSSQPGLDNAVGVIVGTFIRDPTDSKWNDDSGMEGLSRPSLRGIWRDRISGTPAISKA